MSYGMTSLRALLHDASITDLLTNGVASVYYGVQLPDKTPSSDSVILFYRPSPVNLAMEYLETDYSVNCYAEVQADAEAIALAVSAVVNRYVSGGRGYRVNVLTVIPQPTQTDGFNAPLEVHMRARTFD